MDDVKAGDILSASGREPATSISEKIGMSVPAVIDRINKMVLSEGGNPSDIVRLTTFVTKIDDLFPLEGEIVEVFNEFFGDQKPTNAIMEVSRLAKPSLVVEIEATVIFD